MTPPKLVALKYSGKQTVGPLDYSIVGDDGEPVVMVEPGSVVWAPASLAAVLVEGHGNAEHWNKTRRAAKKATAKKTAKKATTRRKS